MKKLVLITLALCLAVSVFAKINLQAGVGLDLFGKESFSNAVLGEDSEANPGLSVYAELLVAKTYSIGRSRMGIGAELQLPRKLEDFGTAEHRRQVTNLPAYATFKYVLLPTDIAPEIIGQVGYNFLLSHKNYEVDNNPVNATGGLYWGAGIGLDYETVVLQLMYKSHKTEFKWEDVSLQELRSTNTHSQLSIQLGIIF
jgi:hypothetical protein